MKMINTVDMVDGSLMLFGLTISLQDIQSILSIIIIVIDILWILGKIVIKFFRYINDGDLDEEEALDLLNDLDDLKKIKKEDDKK